MGFGVFIHRSDSIYDDSPAERYQFPRPYLRRVQGCIGDWIVYYEPRKVTETRGYFAIAKVAQVIEDPASPGMYLALIEPGSYLDFARPVPFSDADGIIERGVLNEHGRISGRAQAAVRPLSPADFDRIVTLGLDEDELLLPRTDTLSHSSFDNLHAPHGVQEDQTPYLQDTPRERISRLTSRIIRDRVFRQVVLRAYDNRCAISGLKLINGGGRAEVEAAHIRPVEAHGPDVISNGIALSGTAHWMFDRGLISLSDTWEIHVSRHSNDPDAIHSFINESGHAIVPRKISERPHPRYLQWHREHCFKS